MLHNQGTLEMSTGINLAVVNISFPADPRQNLIHKLSYAASKCVFSEHTFSHDAEVQIFHKNHASSVTQLMCQFQVKVAPTISYLFMNSGYLLIHLRRLLDPFFLFLQSALEQFKLTVQVVEKARA
jgi:hypothetical protein